MDVENNEENKEVIFSFDGSVSGIDNEDEQLGNPAMDAQPEEPAVGGQMEEPAVQAVEHQTQFNISTGTQEKITPVRFRKCSMCKQLRVDVKHEEAKVKRLESERKSDKIKLAEASDKLRASMEEIAELRKANARECGMVQFLKVLQEKTDRERMEMKKERDRYFKKVENMRALLK